MKSETAKMEKKIKAIKKFLAKPKNEHQMKNNVEIELTDLQARIQQNLDFWGSNLVFFFTGYLPPPPLPSVFFLLGGGRGEGGLPQAPPRF